MCKFARIRIGDDYGLEIADLRADDRGTYTCEVDIMGKPIHISHTVRFVRCIRTFWMQKSKYEALPYLIAKVYKTSTR